MTYRIEFYGDRDPSLPWSPEDWGGPYFPDEVLLKTENTAAIYKKEKLDDTYLYEDFTEVYPEKECEPYEQEYVPYEAVQENPQHYKKGQIECIDYVKDVLSTQGRDFMVGYLWGTIIPYMHRWRDKGGVDDLKKAKQYLEWLIEYEERGELR